MSVKFNGQLQLNLPSTPYQWNGLPLYDESHKPTLPTERLSGPLTFHNITCEVSLSFYQRNISHNSCMTLYRLYRLCREWPNGTVQPAHIDQNGDPWFNAADFDHKTRGGGNLTYLPLWELVEKYTTAPAGSDKPWYRITDIGCQFVEHTIAVPNKCVEADHRVYYYVGPEKTFRQCFNKQPQKYQEIWDDFLCRRVP
jgi:hypothetical protein